MTDHPSVTDLLKNVRRSDADAGNQLFSVLYDELRTVAGHLMAKERAAHTLQPTELVHEVWMRSAGAAGDADFESRRHFVGWAARAMHHVLVDHARARGRAKRGEGSANVPLDAVLVTFESAAIDVLSLHDVIEKLQAIDPDLAKLVELRYFAGLTIQETADLLSVTTTRVERQWRVARMWLRERLGDAAS